MRLLPFIFTLALLLIPALALGASFPNARWKAEEQKCIAACPAFPRFAGIETDAQYQRRIKAENAYNKCYGACTKQYEDRVRLRYQSHDDGSQGYNRRNGGK
ncbi:MAG: hypothetical protein AB7E32_10840 [Desulfovibrio sp.]